MKNFLIFLFVIASFASSAQAYNECAQMCGNQYNGTASIVECYQNCGKDATFKSKLKNDYNQAISGNNQSGDSTPTDDSQFSSNQTAGFSNQAIKCPGDSIATNNTCMPRASYCGSFSCKYGGCPECSETSATKANKPDCNDPEIAGTQDCSGAGAGTKKDAGGTTASNYEAQCASKGGTFNEGNDCVDANGKMIKMDSAAETAERTEVNDLKPDGDSDVGLTCSAAHQMAGQSCDSERKDWMSGISQVTQQLGPAINQINPSTCGPLAAAQSGAQASIAAFEVMCNSAMKKCTEACAKGTGIDATYLADCKKIGTKAAQANQQVAAAMMTLKGSVASCQNAFGSMDNQAQAYCASNPSACQFNLPGGVQANALQADQAGGSLPNPGLGATGGSDGAGKGANLNMAGLLDEEAGGIGAINPSKPGEDPGGAKGGGHVAGGGGGGQGGADGGRGGGKKEGLFSNILSGFFGSGGGSGGGGGIFGKLFGGGSKADAYAASNPNAKKTGPDLRQFLPGGLQDPNRNRGIAGQFIGRDGMSGPHSDIWKNINNRYQYKRASLLP